MQLLEEQRADIVKVLSGIKEVELAYLYGSYASGLATNDSDIDIALLVKKNIPKKNYLKIESEIALALEKNTSKECDVRIINNAPLYFLQQIIYHGEALFVASEAMRIEFEAQIIMRYLDIKPVYDLYDSYREKRLERGEFGVKYQKYNFTSGQD